MEGHAEIELSGSSTIPGSQNNSATVPGQIKRGLRGDIFERKWQLRRTARTVNAMNGSAASLPG